MTLRYSQQHVTEADLLAVAEVMRSDWLTCGPKVEAFEAALAEYTGARYAVAVSSGTAALHLAYLVSEWRNVTTSPLTFVATANAAVLAGMFVSFVDVDRATGNALLDESYAHWDIPTSTMSSHGNVPVHYAGRAAVIPSKPAVPIIEDACHALGAMDFDGCSRVGSCAHSLATCFSFHPVKPITTLGEGGAVTTNDQGFADAVRSLRSHGRDSAGLCVRPGLNYRMTEAAAAMGIEQLKRCDEMRERRWDLAMWYHTSPKMQSLGAEGVISPRRASAFPPLITTHDTGGTWLAHAWHLYPIRVKHGRRDEVKAKLQAQGIGVQVHYNPPVHLHPYYRERFGRKPGDFPEAEAWAAEELSLPLHSGMTEADVERVVNALREALNG